MLRLASDENFNADIVRGLLRRLPDLDIVRVQDAGLSGADDPAQLTISCMTARAMPRRRHAGSVKTLTMSASRPMARCGDGVVMTRGSRRRTGG